MFFISEKRFEEEVNKRVDEAVRKCEERYWIRDSDKAKGLFIEKMHERLIAVEKKNDIDHPSHHTDNGTPWW